MNYYNEFDPFAAAWLRELIKQHIIPDGIVDERSIVDVRPEEIKEFTQCHFFAGIGGWSYALQIAGWDTSRPVWTGSCPCQPFSSAGKQKGKSDERHLWPVWFNLIRQSRPPVVFGEQVSAAIRHGWWDDVADDLERESYTTRAEIRPAYGVGAPHKRERLWFVADTECEQTHEEQFRPKEDEGKRCTDLPCGCGMDNQQSHMADSGLPRLEGRTLLPECTNEQPARERGLGTWSSGVWINCPDGKQRLIEPSICLLAHGIPNRVGKLRGYGNAIVPQVAAEFIKSYMEVKE